MFQAHPLGILALVAVAMCWALAVVLFRVGTPGSVARKLALVLVVEGVTLGSSGSIAFLFASPEETMRQFPALESAFWIVHTLGDSAMLALYPPFLAAALHTKLTRPFGGKRMRIGIGVASVVLFFAVLWSPLEVGATLLYLMLSLLFGFTLVASVHAWLVTPPGIARDRARTFALAFGLRDVCWGFVYGSAIWRIAIGVYGTEHDPDIIYIIYMLGTLLYIPIIAYGILRTQLFDIDLRIRWTLKQSTLAAAIVAIMFILSEGAERLLSAELGNVGSLMVAALVVFALTPLQRFAERVATVAMPNTQNTPEYKASRKLQVYEAALSEALQEGGISQKERALLVHLRDSLGISASDTEAIEAELQMR